MRGRSPFPKETASNWHAQHEWSGAADFGGPNEVAYSRTRRVVRVLGREFALPPDGQTLIVLVDDNDGEPTFTERTVPSEAVANVRVDPSLDKKTNGARMTAAHRVQHATWDRLLRSDPTTLAFLERAD